MKIEIGINFDKDKVTSLNLDSGWKENLNIIKDVEIAFKVEREDMVLLPLLGHLANGNKIERVKEIAQKAFEQIKEEINEKPAVPTPMSEEEKKELKKKFNSTKLNPPGED